MVVVISGVNTSAVMFSVSIEEGCSESNQRWLATAKQSDEKCCEVGGRGKMWAGSNETRNTSQVDVPPRKAQETDGKPERRKEGRLEKG